MLLVKIDADRSLCTSSPPFVVSTGFPYNHHRFDAATYSRHWTKPKLSAIKAKIEESSPFKLFNAGEIMTVGWLDPF